MTIKKSFYWQKLQRDVKRFKPLEWLEITKIYRIVKVGSDSETALTVSLQLQEYERLKKLENKYNEFIRKSDSEVLRELAEKLDNQDTNYN